MEHLIKMLFAVMGFSPEQVREQFETRAVQVFNDVQAFKVTLGELRAAQDQIIRQQRQIMEKLGLGLESHAMISDQSEVRESDVLTEPSTPAVEHAA